MNVSFMKDSQIDLPSDVVELFWEWMEMWKVPVDDGYEGMAMLSAYALGYEVGLRNASLDTAPKRIVTDLGDWGSKEKGSC